MGMFFLTTCFHFAVPEFVKTYALLFVFTKSCFVKVKFRISLTEQQNVPSFPKDYF